MKKQRKHYTPEEKVAILRRHLLEQVPISELCEKQVRVLEANAPAITLWRCGISIYSLGSYREEQHTVNGRPWKFFRFVSNRAKPGMSSG
jgi:hypothetical protein